MGLLRALDPADLAGVPFTYPEVGATRHPALPPGYGHVERSVVVGSGTADLERAAAAVFGWQAQRSLGLRVRATGPASEPGTVVVLTAGSPRAGYDIPCRVVWAQPTGDERGFAYGTLPGHPESGEEAFLVRLQPDGDVVFTVRVFARPVAPLARLGGPVTTLVQRLAIAGYLAAIRRATRER